MSKDQLGFILNFIILTLILNFAFSYFFPVELEDDPNTAISRAPTEITDKSIQKNTDQRFISFNTDTQNLLFNENSGDLATIQAKDFFDDNGNKIQLLFSGAENTGYQILSTGVIETSAESNVDVQFNNVDFSQSNDEIKIVKTSNEHNIKLIQTYRKTTPFELKFTQYIENNTSNDKEFYIYTQLENTHQAMQPGTIPGFYMFQGASFYTSESNYKKIPFSKFKKNKFNQFSDQGWFAFSQRYFVTAIKPDFSGNFYSKYIPNFEESIAGHLSEKIILKPGASSKYESSIYSGPENVDLLKTFHPKLDMVIDYGMLWPIAKMFFYLLTFIHSFVHNWGAAIILTTLVMKLALLYHSQKSLKSMDKMRKLQPELEKIKEQYKDNQQQLYSAMTSLYSTHKVNPISGLLLNFLQIPFFIAFYSVLMESIELRNADFLWISDLSIKDPYYILPLMMGATMYLQQMLSPPPQDETMAVVMRLMPVIFTFFFLQFPSGLVLYWISNTIFTVIHMGFVRRASARNSSA